MIHMPIAGDRPDDDFQTPISPALETDRDLQYALMDYARSISDGAAPHLQFELTDPKGRNSSAVIDDSTGESYQLSLTSTGAHVAGYVPYAGSLARHLYIGDSLTDAVIWCKLHRLTVAVDLPCFCPEMAKGHSEVSGDLILTRLATPANCWTLTSLAARNCGQWPNFEQAAIFAKLISIFGECPA